MPRVSKNQLSHEMQTEIVTAFIDTLGKIKNSTVLRDFINDLLTFEEKIMLSKRFMAIILLQRGYNYSYICELLKMSATTIHYLNRDLARGASGHQKVYEDFFKESKKPREEQSWKIIAKILDIANLPIKGSPKSMRRWKNALNA